ncbi:alpha/beta-hydrolase [Hymenopellis radicata]|nr:alpha/beta-hydrolase [Hymenopellis radicata]
MSIQIDSLVLDVGLELKLTAKRYRYHRSQPTDGLTLLFTHAIASHKEQWEPVIEALFELQKSHSTTRIREAWSLDLLHHGDASVINEEALNRRKQGRVSIPENGAALCAFIMSQHVVGHRIVAIGHSYGFTCLLSAALHLLPKPPLIAMISVEPSLVPLHLYEHKLEERTTSIFRAVTVRRDQWQSKADAYAYMKKRTPWKTWDDRVLKLHVEHGLRAMPGFVTLKCTKEQEASAWGRATLEEICDVAARVSEVVSVVPTHVMFGEMMDVIPLSVQNWLATEHGTKFASIKRILGVGHFIPQEDPDIVASCIFENLVLACRQNRSSLSKANL